MDAPERIWFVHVGKSIVPNSERTGPEDVEYVRADLMAELVEVTLDAANAYMVEQYGNSALAHPVDRSRVLAKIKEQTP